MKWLKVFIACFAIVAIGYLAWNNEEGRTREVRIVEEYQAIQQPQGAEVVFYKLERKFVNRWIFSCYKYPMSVDEVQRYYEQLLENGGWKKKKRQLPPGNIAYIYEKENLVFNLQLNKDDTWSVFMGYSDEQY